MYISKKKILNEKTKAKDFFLKNILKFEYFKNIQVQI